MDSREINLLERHFKRLEQCLEPYKLLRYLNQVGVLDEDDVENVKLPNGERSTRETQVQVLLDILKRRECGLKHFIKALLRSKTQDYLARELLEDEHFTEIEVTAFINETEHELDESQAIKLKLLEQLKKEENARSSRSSMVLSDSGCDPDEKVDHDDSEIVDFLMRELEHERKLRQDTESVHRSQQMMLTSLTKKQGSSLSGLRKDLSLFRSVGFLNTLREGKDGTWPGLMTRSASLNFLNNNKLFKTGVDQQFELVKWASCGDEINEKSENDIDSEGSSQDRARMKELAEKVENLEQELVREKSLRNKSEKEVELLSMEKEELYEELDETRYQLYMSQQDLRFDENELRFDEEEELEYESSNTKSDADIHHGPTNDRQEISNSSWQFPNSADRPSSDGSSESPMSYRDFSASKEYYSLSDIPLSTDRLSEQVRGMHAVTGSWVKLNVQHYELDDYDTELEVEQDKTPLTFLETLRKLRMRTNALCEDAVSEGKDLHLLRDRFSGGHSSHKKSIPNRRRNSICFSDSTRTSTNYFKTTF